MVKIAKGLKYFLSLAGWRQFFKILNKKEQLAFLIFLILFLGSSFYLCLNFYFTNTEIQPARGGIYIEGMIGQPRFINPIYASISDVDQDLTELIFSGLYKYNSQGQIIPDLAEDEPEIKQGGRIYEVYLKENLFWQDSNPLTVDDVIFTIKTIQNSDYKSPLLANWIGVEVEKISDSGIRFILKNPYGSFLKNLTQKIIPEHIWKDIPARNFPLAIYNLKPLGSGPYKLKGFKQNKEGRIVSLDLVRNPKYAGRIPNLSQISFRFFDKEKDLLNNYQSGKIKGFSLISLVNLEKNDLKNLKQYPLSLPRYFAVFFNPEKSKILADQNIRLALNYGINKQEILEKILEGKGRVVDSPILPEFFGFNPPSKIYQFEPETAKEILKKSGFVEKENGYRVKIIEKIPAFQFKTDLKKGSKGKEVEELQKCLSKDPEVYPKRQISGFFDELTRKAVIRFQEKHSKDILEPWGFKKGTGLVQKSTRNKLNELCFPQTKSSLPLKFSLTTVNQPILISVAELLKEQWSKIGVAVEIKTFDISQLEKEVMKQRDYESLLFGEVLTMMPDPFPFWHSLQKNDPGLNLAIYKNKKADKLLEEARQIIDETERRKKLEEFQNILIEDSPAVFLYNPDYLYFVSKKIKGIKGKIIVDPSKRFSEIENWYIKTRRVFK